MDASVVCLACKEFKSSPDVQFVNNDNHLPAAARLFLYL